MFSRVAVAGLMLAGLGALLSSCAGDPDAIYAQSVGMQCANLENSVARAICNQSPPGRRAAQVSRYCYATIGTSNCFDRPDPDRKNQALGSSGY